MILFRSIVANDNDSSHKSEGPQQGEDLQKKLQKLLIVLNRGTFVMQNTRPKLFFYYFLIQYAGLQIKERIKLCN